MATEAGKQGYMISRCHQGGIDDGYFPPLDIVDRVAVDTASTLEAFLNRFVAFNFSGSSRILTFCPVEIVPSQRRTFRSQSALHHCHPGVMLRIPGILVGLYIAVNRIPFPYILYTSPHLHSINRKNELFDILERMCQCSRIQGTIPVPRTRL